jgi:hypothetical protein
VVTVINYIVERYGPGVRLVDDDVLAEEVGRAWLVLAARARRVGKVPVASSREDEPDDSVAGEGGLAPDGEAP